MEQDSLVSIPCSCFFFPNKPCWQVQIFLILLFKQNAGILPPLKDTVLTTLKAFIYSVHCSSSSKYDSYQEMLLISQGLKKFHDVL